MNNKRRQEIERRIVAHLCDTMRKHGWAATKVDDGGDVIKIETTDDVLDVVFSVDEATIYFKKLVKEGEKRCGCAVVIALGNDGYDCIADYGYTDEFRKIMEEEVDPFCDAFLEEV